MKRTFRFYFALTVAKCANLALKILGRKASYFPGKVALSLCPDFLGMVEKPKIVIAITGTNGKTTVANLLLDCLENCGYKVINNKAGSNVNAGIASSLVQGVTLGQKVKGDMAIFEVDERSSPKVYPYIKPNYLICTNLIRDSLRRNAHPEFIFNIINSNLPKETKLILNADDLISSSLGAENEKVYYGIDKLDSDYEECPNIINDIAVCPKCHTKMKYNYVRNNHIGNGYCPNCDFKSKQADYHITKIDYEANEAIVDRKGHEEEYKLPNNNSIFNIYNELAVITFLREYGFSDEKVQELLKNIKITKSRYEDEEVDGYKIISYMTKGGNPVATSGVFDYVRREPNKKDIIMMIENIHDGEDWPENITWIYDTDFEFLKDENIDKIIIGGIRSQDYRIRCLLAGIPEEKIVCDREETETYKYLSLDKNKDIYVLFDLDSLDKLATLQQNIRNRIKEGK